MQRNYEAVFITTPVLSEEQMKETVGKFRKLLEQDGAEIVNEEHWGLRKLAYPIQKKSTGFYNLLEFKADGRIVDNLEVEFKRDERILRFLTVHMERHAVEYAQRRRKENKEKSKNAAQKTEEE
ncbi:MAG: 30S ribosomal protein S6 [Bacteroidales bacterium]